MEMWDEGSIWSFSNTGTQAARFFCCWRSEKLFPVISHLVTSRTNILLLLAPAVVVVVFFFNPSTDRWHKSFDNFLPSSKEVCLCGTFIKWSYAPVTHFILLAEPKGSRGDPVETFNSLLCHVLWRCLLGTSPLLCSPFVSEVLLQEGEEIESKLWYLCLHKNKGFLIMLCPYSGPRIGVLISLCPSLGVF